MALLQEGRVYSIVTDQLGTPTEAYDQAGQEVWRRRLDMNGKVLEEVYDRNAPYSERVRIPFLFQGQYCDHETGLAYNRFRYYDPELGRYISEDPIRFNSGTTALHSYVENTNSWVDVLGLVAYAPKHHIATNKDKVWAPKFRDLFKKYGLGRFKNGRERKDVLNDPRNIVEVAGHKGPHNEQGFHEYIYKRLEDAGNAGGAPAFKAELAKLKTECLTPGSEINKIITKTYQI